MKADSFMKSDKMLLCFGRSSGTTRVVVRTVLAFIFILIFFYLDPLGTFSRGYPKYLPPEKYDASVSSHEVWYERPQPTTSPPSSDVEHGPVDDAKEDDHPYAPPGFAPHTPLRNVTHDSRLAIVTFLDVDQIKGPTDKYFIGTRVLTYQMRHAKKTQLTRPNIDWVVLTVDGVDQWKIDQLRADGAQVVVTERLDAPSWAQKHSIHGRWANQFTKLLLFRWIQYDRILFIDNDMILQSSLDNIFYEDPVVIPSKTNFDRKLVPRPPEEYVFAARADYAFHGYTNHPMPPPDRTSDYFNGGWWLLSPAVDMFEYLLKMLPDEQKAFNLGEFMEQDFLNWAFRRCDPNPTFNRGHNKRLCSDEQRAADPWPMPWADLHYKWTSNFISDQDFEAGVIALHGKHWEDHNPPLKADVLWRQTRDMMEAQLGPSYMVVYEAAGAAESTKSV